MGLLEGEYHIRLDPQAELVQHAPRRVPVALRDRRQETLDDRSGTAGSAGSGDTAHRKGQLYGGCAKER